LRVRGEREYQVAPLALPVGDVVTGDHLAASPAGALMLDRAREVSPHLSLDAADVRALSVLCHRMAGLPLAIELAAAHLRLLGPQGLLRRLEDLTASAGARDLPARQRSMRATLDWSYGLLEPDQQTLFRLLGIFRAGAEPQSVEDLVELSGELRRATVLNVLEGLLEQSLVVVRTDPAGQDRIDMLEPVAQYARSRLVGAEAARAARAHARVYRRLAERAAAGYERADQVSWLARTAADEANLLVAIDRSLDLGDGDTAGRITWAMWLYWWLRGQPNVGRRRAERCLAAELAPAVRGRVHLAAATMSYAAGDLPTGGRHWAKAFRIGAQEHDPEIGCKGRAGTGLAALAAGHLERAAEDFHASLPLAIEAGEAGTWMRSLVHVWLGTVLLLRGNTAGAVIEMRRGLELARDRGDRLATYVALYNLGQAAIAAGDQRQARIHLEEGITLSEHTQDMANLAYFLESLAVVEAADAAPRRLAVLLGAAQSLREEVGADIYGYYLPDEALRRAAAQSARNALGQDVYDDAVDHGRALNPHEAVQFALDPALAP
jgi:predicted ATPase